MTLAIGSQNKKYTGVKIALATVLSFSLIMMPVIAVATTAALPVIAVEMVIDWVKDWFDVDVEQRANEWFDSEYSTFQSYSVEEYPQIYFAEAISCYYYIGYGYSIFNENMTMDMYMYYFSQDYTEDEIYDMLETYTGNTLRDDSALPWRQNMRQNISSLTANFRNASNGSSTAGSGTASSESVENAIQWAIAIANDDSHGYCWRHRLENEFDCSSLVCRALRDGGGFNISSITSTHNMISVITASDSHWTWIPRSELGDISKVAVLNDASSLQRGDILLNIQSHTEIYLGGGQNVGAHMNYTADGKGKGVYCDGSAIDQRDLSGKEVSVDSYWDDHWDGVLRYVE